MGSPTLARFWLPGTLAAAVLLSTCDPAQMAIRANAPAGSDPDRIEQTLQGSWLREYSLDGVAARRVLTLGPGHAFWELVQTTDTAGHVVRQLHEGHWFYDGVNLKRKYTSVNGEPPSRLRVPFATFQVALDSRDEFHGVDRVHGHEVHYHRIALQARPLPECERGSPAAQVC